MGWNLAEHLNIFYQFLGISDTNKFSVSTVQEFLHKAEGFVNKESRTIRDRQIFNAASDTPNYSIATYLTNPLLWYIDDVYYSTTDSTERERLLPTSIKEMDDYDLDWREETGDPTHWLIDKITNEILFYPYESTVSDGTNCIAVRYRQKHTKMTTYYTTGTVTVTEGSTTVEGSGTTFTNVAAGDKFGIGKLLDKDTAFPEVWYTISSVTDADTIVLTSAYAEADGSSQSYIIASPSTIDNEELNMCSTLFAIADARRNMGDRQGYSDDQNEALSRLSAEVDRLEYQPYNITQQVEYVDLA